MQSSLTHSVPDDMSTWATYLVVMPAYEDDSLCT